VKEIHVEHLVQAKESRNVDLKIIILHGLGYGVRPIKEWAKLPMGSCKASFLQVQPNFVTHLKLIWNPMLIMTLLVLVIGLLQDILNLLAYVLDPINEPGGFVSFYLSRR
jgi:hypothetical protein